MSRRPTPETDAFAKAMYSRGVDCHHDGIEALKHAKRLERERDEVREEVRKLGGWKESAMQVLGEWERVWEAAGRPGGLGASKAAAVLAILANKVNNAEEGAK